MVWEAQRFTYWPIFTILQGVGAAAGDVVRHHRGDQGGHRADHGGGLGGHQQCGRRAAPHLPPPPQGPAHPGESVVSSHVCVGELASSIGKGRVLE